MTTTLWANGTIRVETGFLALFIAFVIKSEYAEASGFQQLLLLGVVGVAAGIGGFIGNGLGARLPLSKPETVSILSLAATAVATLVAVLVPGLPSAAIVGLVGSTASSLAKVCLDSVIQHELPEASRASAFGLSETVLQLSWVFGGVVGLLIGGVWSFGHDSVYAIGFAVITVVLVIGLVQSWLVRSGRSLFPWLDYSKLTKHFRRSGKGDGTGDDPQGPEGREGPAGAGRRAAAADHDLDRRATDRPGAVAGRAEPGCAMAAAPWASPAQQGPPATRPATRPAATRPSNTRPQQYPAAARTRSRTRRSSTQPSASSIPAAQPPAPAARLTRRPATRGHRGNGPNASESPTTIGVWLVAARCRLPGCSTACEAPQPDVTFYGNRAAVDTGPTTVCDVDQQAATVYCPEPDAGGPAAAVDQARSERADQRPVGHRATGPGGSTSGTWTRTARCPTARRPPSPTASWPTR